MRKLFLGLALLSMTAFFFVACGPVEEPVVDEGLDLEDRVEPDHDPDWDLEEDEDLVEDEDEVEEEVEEEEELEEEVE